MQGGADLAKVPQVSWVQGGADLEGQWDTEDCTVTLTFLGTTVNVFLYFCDFDETQQHRYLAFVSFGLPYPPPTTFLHTFLPPPFCFPA